jgi:AbrB family looped-hinge helix DNA binding protein
MKELHQLPTLYGMATVGPKGQIVIPVEARQRLGIKPGDKVVVMGPAQKRDFVGLCNENVFRNILNKFDTKLSDLGSSSKTKKES